MRPFNIMPEIDWSEVNTVSKLAMTLYALDGFIDTLQTIVEDASFLEVLSIKQSLLNWINDTSSSNRSVNVSGSKLTVMDNIRGRELGISLNYFRSNYRSKSYLYEVVDLSINGICVTRSPERNQIPYEVSKLLAQSYLLAKIKDSRANDYFHFNSNTYIGKWFD